MRLICFDVETTSKYASSADVLSLGCVIWDGRYHSNEWFFRVDQEVPSDAAAINHLTKDVLMLQSGGLYFDERINEFADIIYAPEDIAVGYNIKAYDIPVMNNNLARCGAKMTKYKSVIDVFPLAREFYKGVKPRLLNFQLGTVFKRVLQDMHVPEKAAEFQFKCTCNNTNAVAHSASWDAFMTITILRHMRPTLF